MRFLGSILLPLSIIFLSYSEGYSMIEEEEKKPPLSITVPPLVRGDSSSSSSSSSLPALSLEERVLLAIEDDPGTIKIIRRTAERKKWPLLVATSYNSAVDIYEQVKHLPFLAITSDHNLKKTPTAGSDPKKGLDFARYLRGKTKTTPIIMYSATEEPAFEETCAELGIEFFRKGVKGYPRVLERLEELLLLSRDIRVAGV